MTVLSVNLNKIALLRNARDIGIPSVIDSARTCIEAGAQGITVHPRPDQRHIRPADVYELADMLTVEFNIEGNPFHGKEGDYPGFIPLVKEIGPAQCTLVPDNPSQKTSDHGWDLKKDKGRLRPIIEDLKSLGIRVSLFMDPDMDQIRLAPETGTDRIELYTEEYARMYQTEKAGECFQKYSIAVNLAQELGLGLNAGHDLNLLNLKKFCSIPGILEVSIGHALISDALNMGLANAVKAYRRELSS
jgi:pyridoxine 5-phosphate synthase